MKHILCILIFITSLVTNAQNKELKISYKYIDHTLSNVYHMELKASDNIVLSYKIRMIKASHRKGDNSYKMTTDSVLLYKNYNEQFLTYEESLGRENLIIKEPLNLFKWTDVSKVDTILGYPCKSAIAEFRGREYTAFYTKDLEFTAAPWKVHGLPGVVLKLVSNDDVLIYEASTLEILDDQKAISNPFAHKEPIDYNNFCKQYKANRKEVIKNRKARAAQQNRKAPKYYKAPRIEIIIPENNTIINSN